MSSPEFSSGSFSDVTDPVPQTPEIIWSDPLAVITYAGSTKAIVIDTDEVGLFRQSTFPVPPGQNFDEVEGRVRRMDNFEEVEVRHVQISVGQHIAFPSITGEDSISFRYTYDSPEGQKSDMVDNEHIVNFLTDRSGGILTFDGQEKPQELAVFFEDAEDPKATVLFFHPEYDMAGLSSFAGFQAFFRSLNIEMASLIGDPDLKKYLAEFDKEIVEGDTYHDMDAVLEVFRARVVASLYAYEQTRNESYLEFPYSQFRNGAIDLLDQNNTEPQKALNDLLWDDQVAERPAARVNVIPVMHTEYDKLMVSRLKTEEARGLREAVTNPSTIISYDVMAAYLTKVYELIRSEDLRSQNDAIMLLKELQQSAILDAHFFYKIGKKKVQISDYRYGIQSDYKSEGTLADLIYELSQKVLESQDEARHRQILDSLKD